MEAYMGTMGTGFLASQVRSFNFKMHDTWDEEGGESLADMIGLEVRVNPYYFWMPRFCFLYTMRDSRSMLKSLPSNPQCG